MVGSIPQRAATCRSVAAYLARDRRRSPAEPAGDRSGRLRNLRAVEDGDLLALSEREVAPRRAGRRTDCWHATTSHGTSRAPTVDGDTPAAAAGILARQPLCDRQPEPLAMITTRNRWTAWSTASAAFLLPSSPTPVAFPSQLLTSRCCDGPLESAQYTARGLHRAARRPRDPPDASRDRRCSAGTTRVAESWFSDAQERAHLPALLARPGPRRVEVDFRVRSRSSTIDRRCCATRRSASLSPAEYEAQKDGRQPETVSRRLEPKCR